MNLIPKDVTIRMEQRKVAICQSGGYERLGIFHKWTQVEKLDYALVENTDGVMEYIPVTQIRFLPVAHDVPLCDLEDTFRHYKILKG